MSMIDAAHAPAPAPRGRLKRPYHQDGDMAKKLIKAVELARAEYVAHTKDVYRPVEKKFMAIPPGCHKEEPYKTINTMFRKIEKENTMVFFCRMEDAEDDLVRHKGTQPLDCYARLLGLWLKMERMSLGRAGNYLGDAAHHEIGEVIAVQLTLNALAENLNLPPAMLHSDMETRPKVAPLLAEDKRCAR